MHYSEDTKAEAVRLFHKYLPLDREGRAVHTTYVTERWIFHITFILDPKFLTCICLRFYPMVGWKKRKMTPNWSDSKGVISRPRERFLALSFSDFSSPPTLN